MNAKYEDELNLIEYYKKYFEVIEKVFDTLKSEGAKNFA